MHGRKPETNGNASPDIGHNEVNRSLKGFGVVARRAIGENELILTDPAIALYYTDIGKENGTIDLDSLHKM